jgi:site-specific recombinase XerD
MERRLAARRLDCTLIFHRPAKVFERTADGKVARDDKGKRVCTTKMGQPIKDFTAMWRKVLKAAGLPSGLIFHDLRRSAVRTLIRSGLDPSVAMKVSGHKTRSMLDRYNIIAESETAEAFAKADAYLPTQPTTR